MSIDEVLPIFLAALAGGLVSGGGIAYVGYEALKSRMRRDFENVFASVGDLNGVGTRVNAFETVLVQVRDTADANSDRLTKIEATDTADSQALGRTLRRIDQRLDEMDARQRNAQSQIDTTAALLNEVSRRLERANH